MKSEYLDMELPVEGIVIVDKGEELTLLPHSFLEDCIYNFLPGIGINASVHHTSIPTNEAGHYVFMCVISDQNRRIEGIGESTENTLTTDIARDYPALMAFKRAFDDAAIKFLRLEGKVYSDQQICNVSEKDVKQTQTYAAPPMEETMDEPEKEAAPAPKSNAGVMAAPPLEDEPVQAEATTTDEAEEMPPLSSVSPVATETPKRKYTRKTTTKPESKPASKANAKARAAEFTAPPLEGLITEEEEIPVQETTEETSFSAPPLDENVPPLDEKAAVKTAVPQTEQKTADKKETPNNMDRFNVVVNYGLAKQKNLTIPQLYEQMPNTLKWVATVMQPYTDDAANVKQLAAEYIELMENKSHEN